MNIGGIIRGASESFSGLGRAWGAREAGKKSKRGYERAYAEWARLLEQAPEYGRKADPFQQYRGEAAQRLYDIVLGEGDFTTDPGYQFRLQEGQRATERAASARGMNLSSNVMEALGRGSQEYASAEYDKIVNRLIGLAGATPQNAIAGAQLEAGIAGQATSGMAGAMVGRGEAGAASTAAMWEYLAQSNEAAGRGVASIWEGPMGGGGSTAVPSGTQAGGFSGGMGGIQGGLGSTGSMQGSGGFGGLMGGFGGLGGM